jgi:hypothetical protein
LVVGWSLSFIDPCFAPNFDGQRLDTKPLAVLRRNSLDLERKLLGTIGEPVGSVLVVVVPVVCPIQLCSTAHIAFTPFV